MSTASQTQRVNAHEDTTLMLEVQVTDDRCTHGHDGAAAEPVEDSCDHDAGPGFTVPSGDAGDGREQVARQVDGPTSILPGQRHNQQRANTGKDEIQRQL